MTGYAEWFVYLIQIEDFEETWVPLNISTCTASQAESYFKGDTDPAIQAITPLLLEFNCVKELDELKLQGNIYSPDSAYISIHLEKCIGHDHCKSESEQREFFSITDYQVIMMQNTQTYNPNEYASE